MCECVCVYLAIHTVGTRPPAITAAERRESFRWMEYFYFLVHRHLQMSMNAGFGCHVGFIDSHSPSFMIILSCDWNQKKKPK